MSLRPDPTTDTERWVLVSEEKVGSALPLIGSKVREFILGGSFKIENLVVEGDNLVFHLNKGKREVVFGDLGDDLILFQDWRLIDEKDNTSVSDVD